MFLAGVGLTDGFGLVFETEAQQILSGEAKGNAIELTASSSNKERDISSLKEYLPERELDLMKLERGTPLSFDDHMPKTDVYPSEWTKGASANKRAEEQEDEDA